MSESEKKIRSGFQEERVKEDILIEEQRRQQEILREAGASGITYIPPRQAVSDNVGQARMKPKGRPYIPKGNYGRKK